MITQPQLYASFFRQSTSQARRRFFISKDNNDCSSRYVWQAVLDRGVNDICSNWADSSPKPNFLYIPSGRGGAASSKYFENSGNSSWQLLQITASRILCGHKVLSPKFSTSLKLDVISRLSFFQLAWNMSRDTTNAYHVIQNCHGKCKQAMFRTISKQIRW